MFHSSTTSNTANVTLLVCFEPVWLLSEHLSTVRHIQHHSMAQLACTAVCCLLKGVKMFVLDQSAMEQQNLLRAMSLHSSP